MHELEHISTRKHDWRTDLVWRLEKMRHCWKLTEDSNSITTFVLLSNTLFGKAWWSTTFLNCFIPEKRHHCNVNVLFVQKTKSIKNITLKSFTRGTECMFIYILIPTDALEEYFYILCICMIYSSLWLYLLLT